MKRLIERLQPLKTAVKSVFFISIAVLVVVELIRLKRTITLESLESALSGLSIWHLALMVVIGLVAVLPMLFYDLILNKELETDYSKSYILETSWAVNTINNLSGFAGLVDVGLRYSFYSEDGDIINDLCRVFQNIHKQHNIYRLFQILFFLYCHLVSWPLHELPLSFLSLFHDSLQKDILLCHRLECALLLFHQVHK